jgi:hypothetical protein
VYGTIVVMGAIVAGATGIENLWSLDAVVFSTVFVLWIAHVYAHGLGESVARRHRLDRAEFVSVTRRELAIPLAAVAPMAAVALGAVGLLATRTAVWLALAIGLLTLAVQGVRYARIEELGPLATAVSIGLNLALGLVIVAMKVFVAH